MTYEVLRRRTRNIDGLVVLAVAFFWFNFYDIHVRYRLTVEVQDSDQVKTGSSVIDVRYNREPTWFPSRDVCLGILDRRL